MRFWTRDGAIALTRRYFSRRSLQNNDRYLIATAALMLFMKSEGEHRNVREFAYCMKAVRSKNPAEKEQLMRKYNERRGDDTDIIATIDSILFAERAILYALNFSIHNDHPYDMFVKLVTSNKMGAGCPLVPPGQEKAHEQWISATGQALTTRCIALECCLVL